MCWFPVFMSLACFSFVVNLVHINIYISISSCFMTLIISSSSRKMSGSIFSAMPLNSLCFIPSALSRIRIGSASCYRDNSFTFWWCSSIVCFLLSVRYHDFSFCFCQSLFWMKGLTVNFPINTIWPPSCQRTRLGLRSSWCRCRLFFIWLRTLHEWWIWRGLPMTECQR